MSYIWQNSIVRLRAVEPGDWPIFRQWDLDSEGARHTYLVPFPQSDESARRWAEREATRNPEGDTFRWVVETPGAEVVGTINTHSCERRNGIFSYGLFIGEKHRRNGYAAGAIKLVHRYYFRELRYQKATVHVFSFNEPSIMLHESLGFKHEGRIRSMVYTDGHFFDEIVLGITAEEFALMLLGTDIDKETSTA